MDRQRSRLRCAESRRTHATGDRALASRCHPRQRAGARESRILAEHSHKGCAAGLACDIRSRHPPPADCMWECREPSARPPVVARSRDCSAGGVGSPRRPVEPADACRSAPDRRLKHAARHRSRLDRRPRIARVRAREPAASPFHIHRLERFSVLCVSRTRRSSHSRSPTRMARRAVRTEAAYTLRKPAPIGGDHRRGGALVCPAHRLRPDGPQFSRTSPREPRLRSAWCPNVPAGRRCSRFPAAAAPPWVSARP